jgi:molybdopterin converting factor small subunit
MKIKFFGILKELLGQEYLEVPFCTSSSELRIYLETQMPAIKNQTFTLAVNREIVTSEHMLKPDDEIACLPPFSGG